MKTALLSIPSVSLCGAATGFYWEIAIHSAYNMFSMFYCLVVNLVFPPRILEWEYLSDCAASWPQVTKLFSSSAQLS